MTAQQFVNLFAQYASLTTWKLNLLDDARLIRSETGECPICFVDRLHNPESKHFLFCPWATKLGKEMGYERNHIMCAADTSNFRETQAWEKSLRKQMLELTDLTD